MTDIRQADVVTHGKPDPDGPLEAWLLAIRPRTRRAGIDHAKYAALVVGWLRENLPAETVGEIGRQLGDA